MIHRYMRFPGGKRRALTFSYDDSTEDDIRLIEIFRKYAMKGTFNLNSGFMNKTGLKHPRITTDKAPEIYTEDVCEIACHGVHHPDLTSCDTVSACIEVIEDRKFLEALFDRQIHGMAYPYGTNNDTVVSILKNAGIYYARTTVSSLKFKMPNDWLRLPATCHHKNPALMELADKFLKLDVEYEPKLFYVWGHSYEFSTNDNWHIIEDFCKKMANNDDIWYCTNIELYTAWSDYQRLERSADGRRIYNPSVRSVWVGDKDRNSWEILPGETLLCD